MIESRFHLNGKFVLHCARASFCREIFRIFNFMKLICRLVNVLNVAESLNKLGSVMCGSVRNMSMSSANADNLYVVLEIVTPLMSRLDLRLWSSGSRVRTNIDGERGQPW